MTINHCWNCQERHIGCHAHCEKYLQYAKEREQIIKARQAEHNKDFLEVQRHREFKDLMILKRKRGRK